MKIAFVCYYCGNEINKTTKAFRKISFNEER